jgi:membrane-associated HD superfamily phosphohydrolase
LTTVFEVVGYAFRLQSSPPPVGNPYKVINFVIQYFFIVVAPVFLSAAIYTTLTSLIDVLGQGLSPYGLSKKFILWFFITSDVIATITQVVGAALIGVAESNNKSSDKANNILLAGLVYQVFTFLLFLILLFVFLSKARKAATSTSSSGLRQFSAALVVSSLLVYLRTIFRLAETAEGVGGYASTHEAFFGALEFAPIVLAIVILGWWHPGKLLPKYR